MIVYELTYAHWSLYENNKHSGIITAVNRAGHNPLKSADQLLKLYIVLETRSSHGQLLILLGNQSDGCKGCS